MVVGRGSGEGGGVLTEGVACWLPGKVFLPRIPTSLVNMYCMLVSPPCLTRLHPPFLKLGG